MHTLACEIPLASAVKSNQILPLFAAFLLSSYTFLGDHYLLSPGRLSSLRKVGDIAKSLLEIQVEYIKKSITFLMLWLNPSKKPGSDLQSLTSL